MGEAESALGLFFGGEDEAKKPFEKDGVEVGHDEKAENDGDDAEELDVVVRVDAVGDVVSDLAVENDTSSAGGENEEANKEGAKIE